MKLTGNKNIDHKILNELDDTDLISYCYADSEAKNICDDQSFWLNRVLIKFPYLPLDVIHKYKEEENSWSDYYIELIEEVDIITDMLFTFRRDMDTLIWNHIENIIRSNRLDLLMIATKIGNIELRRYDFTSLLNLARELGFMPIYNHLKDYIDNRPPPVFSPLPIIPNPF